MKELRAQISSALLMILTAAAAISAFISFQQQHRFRLPDDGIVWSETSKGVTALHVTKDGPGDRAGIRAGDVVRRISGNETKKATDVSEILAGVRATYKARYELRRRGIDFQTTLIVGEAPRDFAALYYQYLIGAAYLITGLFVYFRRRGAPAALHFYVLCLASFVLSTFHFTGKLNDFDRVMYWGNVAAGLLAPTIFLHFCLVFPGTRSWFRRGFLRQTVIYIPAAALLALFYGFVSGQLRISVPAIEMNWLLDRVWQGFLSLMYLLGGVILHRAYRRADDAIARKQLKWVRNGTLLGIVPFTAIYVIPYMLGAVPTAWMNASVASLILVPLTWAYAIVRYRLMDVDIIFQQGYVYTLATICVLAMFYALIFSLGKFEDIGPTAAGALILLATLIFQPIRNWIQEVLDRYVFYKDKYDYRLTLIEFARELSSETDLDAMLGSAADRLMRTLSIQRIGFFLLDDDNGAFRLTNAAGTDLKPAHKNEAPLDLSFLSDAPNRPYFFFEQTRHPLDVQMNEWPSSVRQTIADLEFTYYLPCSVRGRTIAWLGVSRTDKGDFLTSDDVELLVAVCGYIGIAVENARLYRSLERKMEEYERLIESIKVGIVAVDLEDRIESWNTHIEQLTGISREKALGRHVAEIFPEELTSEITAAADGDVHHLYKFVLRPGSTQKVIEMPAAGANGKSAAHPPQREVLVNVAMAPLISRDGAHIGRLVIMEDVTERDELERRLMQADKLSSIGLLAAGVAHEVNTPLSVISTYAQMLTRQVSGDDQKARLLDKISKQTFRASEIVNSLLNFSRTSPTAFDEVNLNRVIQESLLLIEHQLDKAGVTVRLDLEEQIPSIKGNTGKLQQVFLNLFLNARDAMDSGGVLTVRSRAQADSISIDVLDTGHGIHPENLNRIFDPFFTTKTSGRKGTGLGLSVTYGIVREHSGVIDVQSQPGEGTRFHLEFPLARKAVHA